MTKQWTVTIEEADDTTGDLILPFPEEMLKELGWQEGDELEFVDMKDGSFQIVKVEGKQLN